ncbi:MAG: rRNA maturation RNase YbeY [Oligoflexia bacterium]|nr:rRNA maturation RNase YbeY [Oligoflexia bacterium]
MSDSPATWRKRAEKTVFKLLKAARARPALRKLGPASADWRAGVHLVSGAEMTRLNLMYRRKRYATDVLSFAAPEPFRGEGFLGDLVVCLPVLKRQAREMGHSPAEELRVLLAHGVLHLLGLDHETGDSEAARMRRWESRLLAGPRRAGARGLIERAT